MLPKIIMKMETQGPQNFMTLGVSKKLVFVPVYVASAMTGAHRDCLFLASFTQQPEIQYLVS